MINDGHFHLHYPSHPSLVKWSKDLDPSEDLKRVRKIREKYNIDKIVGIFIPPNVNLINKILDENQYIYPGIYITQRWKNLEELKKKAKFNFVKIGVNDCSPYSERVNLIDYAISEGFKKFQIHGSYFTENSLKMIKFYTKECDALIYISHGVEALYSYFSEVKAKDLKNFEGNLLLGTSPSTKLFEVPNREVKKALDDKLENFVVFESDFGLHDRDDFYSAAIDSVVEAVGENEKILYENLNLFLE